MKTIHRGIGSEFGFSLRLLRKHTSHGVVSKARSSQLEFCSGRSALKWTWLLLSENDKRTTCLLPAYLCPSVLQPFQEAGAKVVFYRVDERLQIDLSDLKQRLSADTLALIVIHYFGYVQPHGYQELLSHLDFPVYVIEDITHAWLSQILGYYPLGQLSDIVVSSPRKFFPVPDAAVVTVNDAGRFEFPPIDRVDSQYLYWRLAGLCLRQLYFSTGIALVNRLAFEFLQRAEAQLEQKVPISAASCLSHRVCANLDLYEAAQTRRRNYQILLNGIQKLDIPVHPLYDFLPSGVVPLGFPIITSRRDALKQFLIKHKIYPPVHWRLPEDVRLKEFVHLQQMSREILTIPIDQRYTEHDMAYILTVLNSWKAIDT